MSSMACWICTKAQQISYDTHSLSVLSRVNLDPFQVLSAEFSDVVRRGSENPELVNQIADSLNHLVIWLNEEIAEYARKSCAAGMENTAFNEMLKRINLLYEIWLAMCLQQEYQDEELMKHVVASKEAVKFTYDKCRGKPA